jgi:hypothetical protein
VQQQQQQQQQPAAVPQPAPAPQQLQIPVPYLQQTTPRLVVSIACEFAVTTCFACLYEHVTITVRHMGLMSFKVWNLCSSLQKKSLWRVVEHTNMPTLVLFTCYLKLELVYLSLIVKFDQCWKGDTASLCGSLLQA